MGRFDQIFLNTLEKEVPITAVALLDAPGFPRQAHTIHRGQKVGCEEKNKTSEKLSK